MMRNSRGLLAVLSLISVAAITFGIFTYLHRAVSEQVYVYNCGLVDYKPVSLTKYCADEGVAVGDIQWDTWGAKGATGVGKYAINPCVPNCVLGTWKNADVKVRLTKSVESKGKKILTQIAVTTTDGKNLPLGKSPSDHWELVSTPLG
jgi:hypothetical protein